MRHSALIISVAMAFAAIGNNAWATVITSASSGGVSDSGNQSTSTASVDANNFASSIADSSTGTVGVVASSNGSTNSNASAEIDDAWHLGPTNLDTTQQWAFHWKLEGIVDPAAYFNLTPTPLGGLYGGLTFQYSFGYGLGPLGLFPEATFTFNAGCDGSCESPSASYTLTGLNNNNPIDVTNEITFGTNAAGQTTFLLDVTTPTILFDLTSSEFVDTFCTSTIVPCTLPDTISATAGTNGNGSSDTSLLDFLNTFSVDIIAGNDQSMITSDGGRTTLLSDNGGSDNTIPEPSSVWLLELGLGSLMLIRHKRYMRRPA